MGLTGKKFVMELHDVRPKMPFGLDEILASFPETDESDWSLMIVPDWYECEPLQKFPEFRARLRASAATKVLHGWSHFRGSNVMSWMLNGHANRREFEALPARDSSERIACGSAVLRDVTGTAPEWFCPPQWRMSKLAMRGYERTRVPGRLDTQSVIWKDRRLRAPVLEFCSSRWMPVRLTQLARQQALLGRLMATQSLIRIAVRPEEFLYPSARKAILRSYRRLLAEDWQPESLATVKSAMIAAEDPHGVPWSPSLEEVSWTGQASEPLRATG